MFYLIETYGCQMNAAESAALKKIFAAYGWRETVLPDDAALVLLNTCAVRETAENRFLARLAMYAARKKSRAKSASPLTIAVSGCAAERLGAALQERGADVVLGTKARGPLEDLLAGWGAARPQNTVPAEGEPETQVFYDDYHAPGSPKSFVPIMNGCNNFCSYCIVPYVRGREVSRDPEAVISEIRRLAGQGVREITLLGQNVNAYRWEGSWQNPPGGSAPLDFAGLIPRVAGTIRETSIRWARFLSSHPKDMPDAVIEALAGNPCFCRHLHLPVQHGSDRVLQAMNRRYTRADFLALVRKLREAMPDITFSTDILVGFPGETEEDVEEILSLMEEVRFLHAYMYHYNPRAGTAAYDLPGRIADNVKKERLARVIAAQGMYTVQEMRKRLGNRVTALVEGVSRNDAGELLCRTEHDEQAVVKAEGLRPGIFIEVSLDSLSGNTFRGKFVCFTQDTEVTPVR
jgi:tRNA-2-methylthio-N6-dimethylallyladenosine synthase